MGILKLLLRCSMVAKGKLPAATAQLVNHVKAAVMWLDLNLLMLLTLRLGACQIYRIADVLMHLSF